MPEEQSTKIFNETKAKLSKASGVIINHLDSMKDGEKVTLKDLLEKIKSEAIDIKPLNISLFTNMVVDSYPGVERAKGKNAGIYKGNAPVKASDNRPRCVECGKVRKAKKSA